MTDKHVVWRPGQTQVPLGSWHMSARPSYGPLNKKAVSSQGSIPDTTRPRSKKPAAHSFPISCSCHQCQHCLSCKSSHVLPSTFYAPAVLWLNSVAQSAAMSQRLRGALPAEPCHHHDSPDVLWLLDVCATHTHVTWSHAHR